MIKLGMGLCGPHAAGMVTPALALICAGLTSLQASEEATSDNELLLVVGAAGEPEYGEVFDEAQLAWETAATLGNTEVSLIDAQSEDPLAEVKAFFVDAEKDSSVPLWVVFIGHGTYGRGEARFNLKGTDLALGDFKAWLEPFNRPLIVINNSSSSGAFLPVLSAPGRIIVTATKSGNESNFTSFGAYLAGSLRSPETDLNNDGQNSLYECFYSAARETAAFYEQEGRIATEHPLLDDNGDGKGTSYEALEAYLMGGESKFEVDGSYAARWSLILSPEERALPAEMRQKRNELEAQVDALRRQKKELVESDYYEQIETLAVKIAELYESFDALPQDVEQPQGSESTPGPEPEVEKPGETPPEPALDVELPAEAPEQESPLPDAPDDGDTPENRR